MRSLVLLIALAGPAFSDAIDSAAGRYGSAIDPMQSCEANPHQLSFMDNPPYAMFHWSLPRLDAGGRMSSADTYDLREVTGSTLMLQREGDAPLPETGRRPLWILRLTDSGYCWGRADWPLVRCINPAVRCDNAAPTS